MPRRTPALLAASILAVVIAACSGAAGTATTTPQSAQPTATASSPGASAATASPGTAAVRKVSANAASEAEIAAALTAAGVPNADRWAREVTEYRPYPADDPTLARLQDNLAKYQPDAATLAGILSALQP